MNAKARKTEINLITLGSGVIFLGAWFLIKTALTYLIFGTQIDDQTSEEELQLLNIMIWALSVIYFLFSLYIGASARAEGKGKHKSIAYLIMAGFYALFNVVIVMLDIWAIVFSEDSLFSLIVTTTLDLTTLVILLELIVNAIAIRKIRKKEAAE